MLYILLKYLLGRSGKNELLLFLLLHLRHGFPDDQRNNSSGIGCKIRDISFTCISSLAVNLCGICPKVSTSLENIIYPFCNISIENSNLNCNLLRFPTTRFCHYTNASSEKPDLNLKRGLGTLYFQPLGEDWGSL